ncbi:MAG: helix-turn-helix domain-containing protein [bacterium]
MTRPDSLETPGAMLQAARRAQKLSQADVARITKIPERLVVAVELDEYQKLSGPLYVKSFLQAYASSVQLDPQVVLDRYQQLTETTTREPLVEQVWEEETQIRRIGVALGSTAWRWIALAVVVIVAVVIFFWLGRVGNDEGADGETDPTRSVTISSATQESGREEAGGPGGVDVAADEESGAEVEIDSQAESTPGPQLTGTEPTAPEPAALEPGATERDGDQTTTPLHLLAVADEDTLMAVSLPPEANASTEALLVSDTAESAPAVELTPPPNHAGLPAAAKGDSTLGFAGEQNYPLVLRIIGTGSARVEVRQWQESFSVTLPAAAAVSLPNDGIVSGRPYAVREGYVLYWGTGATGDFEYRIDTAAGIEIRLNHINQPFGPAQTGVWRHLDRESLPVTARDTDG